MPRGNYCPGACGYRGMWWCSQVIRAHILLRLDAFPLCLVTLGFYRNTLWDSNSRDWAWLRIGIHHHRTGKMPHLHHPPVLLGKHLCFAQDRWHIIWDTQSQWHRDTTPLSLWARWSLGFYPTPTIPWFQLHWNSGAQCWLQTKTTSPGQPNQKTEQSLNTGLRRTRILCVQTRNLKSREQTQFCFLLLTWAFIFLKQAARQVPKSPMKCRLKVWCVGAAGSAHFTMGSVQGSATATVTNLGLRKRQAPDSPLINERGIRALYPRRQIAVLSKMCTTINLSLKACWFGFQSSLLGNQREEASRRPSCFEEWTTLVPH